jgi:hypothetical protein
MTFDPPLMGPNPLGDHNLGPLRLGGRSRMKKIGFPSSGGSGGTGRIITFWPQEEANGGSES